MEIRSEFTAQRILLGLFQYSKGPGKRPRITRLKRFRPFKFGEIPDFHEVRSKLAVHPANSRRECRKASFVFLNLSAIINRCVFYPLKSRKCEVMALKCAICGKAPHFGNVVSHANNTRRRRWNPNLKRVRAVVDGVRKQVRVCTGCIRLGRVKKSA